MRAIQIIEDEHRSLAAVLHGLLYLVREIGLRGAAPDFELRGAMLTYVDAFPERFHHPKEDAYLFRRLRERDPGSAGLLDRLEEEHREGAYRIGSLKDALARFQREGKREFAGFAQGVADFASFHWEHMRAEETDVLPRARKHLTPADWAESTQPSRTTTIQFSARPRDRITASCFGGSSISRRRRLASGRRGDALQF